VTTHAQCESALILAIGLCANETRNPTRLRRAMAIALEELRRRGLILKQLS